MLDVRIHTAILDSSCSLLTGLFAANVLWFSDRRNRNDRVPAIDVQAKTDI